MKMNDDELKHILKEGMEYEADKIMEEVNSDPAMKDVVAPEGLYEDIMKQIHEYEDEKEKNRENQTKEEQELIRLGRIYRRKRSRRKYYVLVAATLCALAAGTISLGDGKKVFTEIKGMFNKSSYKRVDTENTERFDGDTVASEEDAYEQIEEKFGFWAVRMYYLPDGMEFVEASIDEKSQITRLFYTDNKEKNILYRAVAGYRTGSTNADIEDIFVQEYEININETEAVITEYKVKEDNSTKWSIDFIYEDIGYTLVMTGFEQDEVEKVVKNLFFS